MPSAPGRCCLTWLLFILPGPTKSCNSFCSLAHQLRLLQQKPTSLNVKTQFQAIKTAAKISLRNYFRLSE